MDLSKITLEKFLCHVGTTASPPVFLERGPLVPPGTGFRFKEIKKHGEYTLVLLDPSGDVAVVDANGDEAGFYTGNSLVVHDEHRGKDLATALVLHAYKYRIERFRGELERRRFKIIHECQRPPTAEFAVDAQIRSGGLLPCPYPHRQREVGRHSALPSTRNGWPRLLTWRQSSRHASSATYQSKYFNENR